MTSQHDPRAGQDDVVGGGAREDAKPFTGAWFFEELTQTRTIRAVEPDGTEHLIKLGDMNSLAGVRLLNAMVRDLTKKEPTS